MSSILIIDGNSLMFRAYYATSYTGNLMQTSTGVYTNAVFGFVNMLNKLLERKPDYVFVAFDAGKSTFRHQSYDEYKAGRKKMPDEFRSQIPLIKEYLDCIKVRHEEMLEYEADDLVATVSEMALKDNVEEIMVVSGDKDLLQLVRGNVKVCLTKKGITELEEYTIDNFFEKMGFNPNQVPDYKGLVGDKSDNLPGIAGIGEKTALKLLSEYNTLENIVANVDSLTGKTKTVVEEGSSTGLTCKKLATLVRDINVEFGLNDIKYQEADKERLVEFYKNLEFKSFLNKLNNDSNNEENANVIEDRSQLLEIKETYYNTFDKWDIEKIKDSVITVIPEVFGDNYYSGEFIGLGMRIEGRSYFISKVELEKSTKIIEILETASKLVTFDYKKLYVCLKRNGITVNKPIFDALLAIYLMDPKKANEDFALALTEYNNYDIKSIEDIYGKGAKAKVPEWDIYSKYASDKAYVLENIYEDILNDVKREELNKLLDIEIGLSKVLGNMELTGLICSREELEKCQVELETKQKEYEKRVYELAGREFKINSPKELGKVLFEELGLPAGKKNQNGYSTDAKELEYLATKYEIASVLLNYRKVTKIISTYINGLFDLMDGFDFIHPLYKQALTQTGRLSSVEPNIQNMPIRDDVGKVIRKAFVSRFDEGRIVSLDYSQIELRVLAAMANDERMINAFNSDVDFHRATAAWIFGKDPNEITSHERSNAKAINFGIVYGMSAWGLSETTGISPKEAKLYIEKYFENYPGIDAFIKNTINQAKIDGYTKTLFNRKRYIPELKSMNKTIYQFGERTAVNSPIQGTAADIIKIAMVKVGQYLEENKLKSQLIAQVHDELVFDCVPEEIDTLIKNVKEIMENVVKLQVKLIASSEVGLNWMEA